MSVNLTINGVAYPFPEPDDEEWGQQVLDWATAVTNALSVSTLADRTSDPSSGAAQMYRRTDQGNILKYFDGTTAFGVPLIP
jgi:hypothetical protein